MKAQAARRPSARLLGASACLLLVLVACVSPPRGKVLQALQHGDQVGFLSETPDRVEFIQWTEIAGHIEGSRQVSYIVNGPALSVSIERDNVSGQRSGTGLTLQVEFNSRVPVKWTGRIARDQLILNIPNGQNLLERHTYHFATPDDYNAAAQRLQATVDARNAVLSADQTLASAVATLQNDTRALANDTRFADVTGALDTDMQRLQTNFQAVKDTGGQQPFDCNQYATFKAAYDTLSGAYAQLKSDTATLNRVANAVATDIAALRSDITTVQRDEQALENALQNPATTGIARKTAVTDVQRAIADAQAQIDRSSSALAAAQSKYGGYVDSATPLSTQADQIVAAIPCAPPQPQVVSIAPASPSSPSIPSGTVLFGIVTPPDGVNVRPAPAAPTRLGCLMQGAVVRLTDGPQQAAGQNWYYAHDFGWISGTYLSLSTSPPVTAPSAAEGVLRAFYDAIDRHDLSAAWALTSQNYRASFGNDFTRWSAAFATTRSVILERVQVYGNTATTTYVSVDSGPVVRAWTTTWNLVNEGGAVRLDYAPQARQIDVCS
jgi:hypothetical protein